MIPSVFRKTCVILGAGIASMALCAGCAAQHSHDQAMSSDTSASVQQPATPMDGRYIRGVNAMVYVPPTPAEQPTQENYALTGQQQTPPTPLDGSYISGINGQVYVPPTP